MSTEHEHTLTPYAKAHLRLLEIDRRFKLVEKRYENEWASLDFWHAEEIGYYARNSIRTALHEFDQAVHPDKS